MSVCIRYTLFVPKKAKTCLVQLADTTSKNFSSFRPKLTENKLILSSASSTSTRPSCFAKQLSPSIRSLLKFTAARQFLTSSTLSSEDSSSDSDAESDIMELKSVVRKLNKFAPTTLAGSWDNVGLLVEPTPPHEVKILFLTNDLTEEVLQEAIEKEANMILAYHPPIFSALKRLTMRNEKERIIVKAIEKRIAIYSPHTSYDAVEGGVNDWLASGLGNSKVEPLEQSFSTCYPTPGGYKLEILDSEQGLSHSLKSVPGVSDLALSVNDNMVRMRASMICTTKALPKALELINKDDDVKNTVQITQLTKPPIPHTGMGRMCTLESEASLGTMVQRVKDHLKLARVQLAVGKGKSLGSPVQTVALCAGSGSSVLQGVLADLYLTGEMSHHEILAVVAQGTSVILCNHSNTERGFLHVLTKKFGELFDGKINVIVSNVDADPLTVV